MDSLHRSLANANIVCDRDNSFARLTKMGCGGGIALVVYPNSVEQLVYAMRLILDSGVHYYVLGQGSKVLACDEYYSGVVLCTKKIAGIHIDGHTATIACGTHTVVCANAMARADLSGAEYMYCLPATVGGAVYMNAGCYGQCTADIVRRVHCFDIYSGTLVTLDNSQCQFGMRTSIFQYLPLLIVSVVISLTKGQCRCIVNGMTSNMSAKLSSQPLHERSLGSSFFTTSGMPASRLIDMAGYKGASVGGAQVSAQHAGFVINQGNATCNDVRILLSNIHTTIQQCYDVQLHREIIYFDEGY